MLPYLKPLLGAPEQVEHDELRVLAAGARIAYTVWSQIADMFHESEQWPEEAQRPSLAWHLGQSLRTIEQKTSLPWEALQERAERLSLTKVETCRAKLGIATGAQGDAIDLAQVFVLHVDGSRNDEEEAGWGWSLRGPGEITLAEGLGPVELEPGRSFLGATEPSNVAGEASAVVQGLRFVNNPENLAKLQKQGLAKFFMSTLIKESDYR